MDDKFNKIARQLQKETEFYQDMIRRTEEKYAQKFLEVLRETLARHNLKHHKIAIDAGMGQTDLMINGEFYNSYKTNLYAHGRVFRIIETLNWIEAKLKENYDWSYHLHGKSLN